jgi:hypothetical protein
MKTAIFILILLTGGASLGQAEMVKGPAIEYPPYPYVLSRSLDNLPHGFITIRAGDETYYYSNGFFYQMQMRIQKYIMVPPPIGAVVFNIPPGYQLMLVNGMTLYEYQGVFYKRVLDGFKVIFPPVS